MKKIFFTLFSLFLIYISYNLILALISHSASYNWLEGLFISVMLNLSITGILAFLGFVYPSSKLLPPHFYFKINQKRIERLYRILGIKYFRIFLLATFWRSKKKRATYFNGKRTGLEEMEFQSKQAEFGHLISFVLIASISVNFLIQLQWKPWLICNLINLLFNFYPVIMQRYLRVRLLKIKKQTN